MKPMKKMSNKPMGSGDGLSLVLDKERKCIVYNGKDYPPTVHNCNCVRRYKQSGNKECLEILSTVVLDI